MSQEGAHLIRLNDDTVNQAKQGRKPRTEPKREVPLTMSRGQFLRERLICKNEIKEIFS